MIVLLELTGLFSHIGAHDHSGYLCVCTIRFLQYKDSFIPIVYVLNIGLSLNLFPSNRRSVVPHKIQIFSQMLPDYRT